MGIEDKSADGDLEEVEHLRRRVAELEGVVAEQARIKEELRASEELARLFMMHTPAAIAMMDLEMRYVMVSNLWLQAYGLSEQNCIGRSHYELFPEIDERWKAIHRRCLAGATESAEEDPFPRANGGIDYVRWTIYPWRKPSGEIGGIIMFTEVVTKRKELEDQLRAQARMVQVLSTPVIPINDQILVMPVIGALETERARQIMDQLLEQVTRARAKVAILDITGVSGVDLPAANALAQIAQAVRLVGARVVLTGIRPEVAQAMVSLGVNISEIVTRGTLESGISFAMSVL